jgi:hypothetical protein
MTTASLNMPMKFRLSSAKHIGHLTVTPNATTISSTTNNSLTNINMSVNGTTTKSGGALPCIGGWGLVPTFNSIVEFFLEL